MEGLCGETRGITHTLGYSHFTFNSCKHISAKKLFFVYTFTWYNGPSETTRGVLISAVDMKSYVINVDDNVNIKCS